MKSIFKSKTAALAFITTVSGAVSFFVPAVGEWVANSSDIILSVLGVVGFALRIATSSKVTLFPSAE
jgi:mannose/fructose/N-acetylgalactosamine-specific phosphotransferase system component IIC